MKIKLDNAKRQETVCRRYSHTIFAYATRQSLTHQMLSILSNDNRYPWASEMCLLLLFIASRLLELFKKIGYTKCAIRNESSQQMQLANVISLNKKLIIYKKKWANLQQWLKLVRFDADNQWNGRASLQSNQFDAEQSSKWNDENLVAALLFLFLFSQSVATNEFRKKEMRFSPMISILVRIAAM